MARTWLRPWRGIVLLLGILIPAAAVFLVRFIAPPSILRWDPPEPKVAAVQYREAVERLQAGDLEAAQKELETLRETDAFNALIHATLGQVHHAAGHLPEAIAATQMAVRLDPLFGEAFYNLACYQLEAGRPEEALSSLARGVAAGFDVRTPARTDPDLEPLREDSRLKVYLEGAQAIPTGPRAVSFQVDPPVPRVGEPFTITLEAVLLDFPANAPVPAMSVSYQGDSKNDVWIPRQIETQTSSVIDGDTARYRWTSVYSMTARAPYAGSPGPWKIDIGGEGVPFPDPFLVIQPSNVPLSATESGALSRFPLFNPRVFFQRPWPAASSEKPLLTILRPGDGAWWAGNLELTVELPAQEDVKGVQVRFDEGLSPEAWFDVLEPAPDGDGAVMLHRVYAFSGQILPRLENHSLMVAFSGHAEACRVLAASSRGNEGAQ